ncbi:MAG: hypothetical protein GEV03_14365 [Streptosporangiales bacterium]|nr:hypothetical protein [Streptosporangiales bacterium]
MGTEGGRPGLAGVLGRDMGPFGRIVRALTGAWLVLAGVSLALDGGVGVGEVAKIAGYVVAATVLYTAALHLLGERVLAWLNPWTATSVLLAPIVVLAGIDLLVAVPAALFAGLYFYVGLSLLVISVTGYGGCEIVGVPVVVLRRRYVVYCALNAVDAVERPLSGGPRKTARLVAGLLAVAAGVYYFLLQNLLDILGVPAPFDPRWGVLLLLPAIGVLGREAWTATRTVGWADAPPDARSQALGAIALAITAAGIMVFGSVFFVYITLTGVIMVGGIVAAVQQARHNPIQAEDSRGRRGRGEVALHRRAEPGDDVGAGHGPDGW